MDELEPMSAASIESVPWELSDLLEFLVHGIHLHVLGPASLKHVKHVKHEQRETLSSSPKQLRKNALISHASAKSHGVPTNLHRDFESLPLLLAKVYKIAHEYRLTYLSVMAYQMFMAACRDKADNEDIIAVLPVVFQDGTSTDGPLHAALRTWVTDHFDELYLTKGFSAAVNNIDGLASDFYERIKTTPST